MKVTLFCSKVVSPFVIVAVLGSVAFGAALAYGPMLAYKSKAVVSFFKSNSDFRTLHQQVNTVSVFERYRTATTGMQPSDARWWAVAQMISHDSWIAPVLRYAKKEVREPQIVQDAASVSDLVAYEINSSASDPQTAHDKVVFFVDYVADAALKIQIDNFVTDQVAAKKSLLTFAALERDLEGYNLSLLENRLDDLKRLAQTYPTNPTASDRQILSIEKNGERFMPVPMQMIAVERERFDIKEKLAKTQRRVDALPQEEAMLTAHQKFNEGINSGRQLAQVLINDLEGRLLVAKKDYEVIALLGYKEKYLKALTESFAPSRLVVAPTFPAFPQFAPIKVMFLAGLLGLLLSLAWQFRAPIWRVLWEQRGDEEGHPALDAPSLVKPLKRA
jgi:hypothetical protein